ncbi:hypothetical protein PNI0212_01901 [Streptococcus pneumoniae PNI0212]|nr:hypothetical protein PNI0212_01901 [Streptococcus pneumoniae PNI0212]
MNSSIRKVKLIYRNILVFKAYCYRFNTLYMCLSDKNFYSF